MGLAEEDGFHLGDSSYRVTMMVWDLGWVDSGLGGSLGFLDATVATYTAQAGWWNIQKLSRPNLGLRPTLASCKLFPACDQLPTCG